MSPRRSGCRCRSRRCSRCRWRSGSYLRKPSCCCWNHSQQERACRPGLRLATSDGHLLVTWGHALVYRYEIEDIGMRNLAIVALTDAGRRVDEVARVFDLTATYVSVLRGRARLEGSAGLGRRRGRPPKLSERQVAQARAWAGSGWTQQAICERLGCARSVISDLLARLGPIPFN